MNRCQRLAGLLPAALGLAMAMHVAVAGDDWPLTAAQLAQLDHGAVLIEADEDRGSVEAQRRGTVRAAVRIAATPATVYRIMTDCATALQYVPHLRRCVVLETTPDLRSQLIEHEVDFAWYLPNVAYVFRAANEPFRSIEFQHVRGDFRENSGRWELVPVAGGAATIVTYRVRMVPKFRVPQWLVRRSMVRELPELMRALRNRCEHGAVSGKATPKLP